MAKNKTLKVVLVEPAGPINVGSVARLCENLSVHQLRLDSPKCKYLDQEEQVKEISQACDEISNMTDSLRDYGIDK